MEYNDLGPSRGRQRTPTGKGLKRRLGGEDFGVGNETVESFTSAKIRAENRSTRPTSCAPISKPEIGTSAAAAAAHLAASLFAALLRSQSRPLSRRAFACFGVSTARLHFAASFTALLSPLESSQHSGQRERARPSIASRRAPIPARREVPHPRRSR